LPRHSIPANPRAPAAARATLVDVIPSALADRLDDVALVLSEVVTNAVKHGSRDRQDEVRLVVEADGDWLHVEVEQSLPALHVAPRDPHRTGPRETGTGLLLVEALADAWGAEPGPPGRVWFDFEAQGDIPRTPVPSSEQ